MNFFYPYYRFVYLFTLVFVVIIFPVFSFFIFIFFDPKTEYQLFFEAKYLSYFIVFFICLIISRALNNLRHEKAPQSFIQVFWIILISIILFTVSLFGYTITKNYFTAFNDDIPIQINSQIKKISAINESYFGSIDNSKYGQIPNDAYGRTERYSIEIIDSNNNSYQTAFFFRPGEFVKTYKSLESQIGNNVIIRLLPNSSRIVTIETINGLGPIYENQFLVSNP